MNKYFKIICSFKLILCIFFLSISFSTSAYAYLDPGTGGLIIQVLIASVVGIGVFFKNIKMKVIEFFFKKNKKDKTDK